MVCACATVRASAQCSSKGGDTRAAAEAAIRVQQGSQSARVRCGVCVSLSVVRAAARPHLWCIVDPSSSNTKEAVHVRRSRSPPRRSSVWLAPLSPTANRGRVANTSLSPSHAHAAPTCRTACARVRRRRWWTGMAGAKAGPSWSWVDSRARPTFRTVVPPSPRKRLPPRNPLAGMRGDAGSVRRVCSHRGGVHLLLELQQLVLARLRRQLLQRLLPPLACHTEGRAVQHGPIGCTRTGAAIGGGCALKHGGTTEHRRLALGSARSHTVCTILEKENHAPPTQRPFVHMHAVGSRVSLRARAPFASSGMPNRPT
eukprot:1465114-Prymnesium_polylepis.1